jgi:hypothetical protein
MAKEKSGEKMYGKRIVSKGKGPDKKGKHHIRHKQRTHKSKGKAGTIPHPSGMSPHSGARKNKLQTALEAREKKVAKQRKKSKGSPAYTAIGLAAGAVPFAGAAGKAIPAIVKGVKTIKAGMRASKAKNPRGAMKQINPKSSLIKPPQSKVKSDFQKALSKDLKTKVKKEKGKLALGATAVGGGGYMAGKLSTDGNKLVSEGYKDTVNKKGGGKVVKKKKSIKAVDRDVSSDQFPEVSKFVNKRGGGRIKGYKKGGPITYRMTGGQVVDNSYD